MILSLSHKNARLLCLWKKLTLNKFPDSHPNIEPHWQKAKKPLYSFLYSGDNNIATGSANTHSPNRAKHSAARAGSQTTRCRSDSWPDSRSSHRHHHHSHLANARFVLTDTKVGTLKSRCIRSAPHLESGGSVKVLTVGGSTAAVRRSRPAV